MAVDIMVREGEGWWYAREEQAQQAAVAAARRREAVLEGMVVGLVLDMVTRTALGVVASQVGIYVRRTTLMMMMTRAGGMKARGRRRRRRRELEQAAQALPSY